MYDTYDEALGYDADHDDPSQYCPHGTWIGSWWGPDYLCGACEMGVSVRANERGYLLTELREAKASIWVRPEIGHYLGATAAGTFLFGHVVPLFEELLDTHLDEYHAALERLERAEANLAAHVAEHGEIPDEEWGH